MEKSSTVCRKRAQRMTLTLLVGASVVFVSGFGWRAEGIPADPALPQPEMATGLYGQTVFYDGLAEERALVKDKSAKVKTGAEKVESIALTDLLNQKEEVLSELTNHLAQMTGKKFSETNRLPATGVILARADSRNVPAAMAGRLKGKGLEAFLICSEGTDRLWIVANDRRGLSYGVYFYLEQLGVRWLMAGKNWTVIPSRQGIAIRMDRLVEPSFFAREYAGAIYSMVLGGRNYKGTVEFEQDWALWKRRMRNNDIPLMHHTGEAFVAENRDALVQHPEYLAKMDGKHVPLYKPCSDPFLADYVWDESAKRFVKAAKPGTGTHQLNGTAKLNAGNPAAVALYSDWIMKRLRQAKAGPEGYAVTTISVDPSDGPGEGNNYEELKAQGVGDGSEGDQAWFIANACARKVRAEFPDVSVVIGTYCTRADPPTFPLEPNVLVQHCGWRGGRKTARLTEDEHIDAWKAKTDPNPMAKYEYWSISDWAHEQPEFNYLDLARKLRVDYARNITYFYAETTPSGGAMGIGLYLASHLWWDIHADETALIEDWYNNAFGPAKAPMKRMMERWAQHWRPISSELGNSYADIAEAEKLAAGNAAVLARVDDYARYLHYLRFHCEYYNAPGYANASRLVECLFSINDSRMTQTGRVIDWFVRKLKLYPALAEEFHLASKPDDKNGPGWSRVHPLSHEELAALIADGQKKYPPPDFVSKSYTGKLVALNPSAGKSYVGKAWDVPVNSAIATMDLQMPEGLAAFPLRVSRNHATKVTVTDDSEKTLFTHWVEPVGKDTNDPKGVPWDEMSVPLAPGHYQVVVDATKNGNVTFQSWKGVPLNLRTVQILKGNFSPRLYFYVPKGLEKIAIFFPAGVHAGGRETPFYQPDGKRAKIEERDAGKLAVIPVPVGMDGKVWSLDQLVQYITSGIADRNFVALNIPQCFSLSPEVLMVPEDAVKSTLSK